MNYLNVAGQCTWIPSPPLTQENLPSQSGKVVIITGANTGIGQKLAEILYCASATVYIAGRNPEKCLAAIEGIKTGNPSITEGKLEFLKLDLGDLSTVKGSAEEFLRREKRLDVLVNNAGVMFPPKGSKTVQGYDLQLGTNCLGPYLFTQLLLPLLQKTAEGAAKDSVRVAWAGSLAVDLLSPVGGAEFDDQGQVVQYEDPQKGYGLSKCGNRFLAKGLAEDDKTGRIVSVCFNPGNLRTELSRHINVLALLKPILERLVAYPAIYGAYTELYCGFSPELTTADNGSFIAPWGRKNFNREDVERAVKGTEEGGSGQGRRFVGWCEGVTRGYR